MRASKSYGLMRGNSQSLSHQVFAKKLKVGNALLFLRVVE